MKKLIAIAFLSLTGLALNTANAPAWCCFHQKRCLCHKLLCCHQRCCSRCCTTICCQPYNAFSPVCCGTITCMGCCPMAFNPCCAPCCPPPCCPPADCCPSYGPSCSEGCGSCDLGQLPVLDHQADQAAPVFQGPMPTPMGHSGAMGPVNTVPNAMPTVQPGPLGYAPMPTAPNPMYYRMVQPVGYQPMYYPGYNTGYPAMGAAGYGAYPGMMPGYAGYPGYQGMR